MSQNVQPRLSLLSLSIAAESAAPIPASPVAETAPRSSQGASIKHRRLSSAGRSRRRLSDARDAATRPFPTSLQTASASLAALSLSSPTVSHRPARGAQPIQVPRATSTTGTSEPEPPSIGDTQLSSSPPQLHTPLVSNSVHVARSGRKRGTIFMCESCSKVYRHPSCLIKHRWEHTPQWREASKFVLSKHQQVQLLEAAAILSHLSPSSASLPEDRSLWPSFLSGGLVPPPASVANNDGELTSTTAAISASSPHASFPISSSVPASSVVGSHRAGSTGPRLHDYAICEGGVEITQVRPGMLGVPTAPVPTMNGKSSPISVPVQAETATTEDDAMNLLALRSANATSESWGSPTSVSVPLSSHSRSHSYSHALANTHSHAPREREWRRSNAYEYGFVSGSGFGYDYKSGSSGYPYIPHSNSRWSLPRSSVRSKSDSLGSRSQSQSASESRSDDEDDLDADVDVGADLEDGIGGGMDGVRMARVRVYGSRMRAWKTEDGDGDGRLTDTSMREDEQEDAEEEKSVGRATEQTWDGMEMEMEMD